MFTAKKIGPAQLRMALGRNGQAAMIDGQRAAVAVVFRPGERGTELLFIQRATKHTDPWSGQMAFPGGRIEPTDEDSHAAAERETWEEVGLDLSPAERLGSLNDLDGGRGGNNLAAIHAHGYWLPGPAPRLVMNHEVDDVLWVPLAMLADSSRYIDHYYALSDSTWPGIQLDKAGQVVWGLTLRFLSDFFARIETPFIALASPPNVS